MIESRNITPRTFQVEGDTVTLFGNGAIHLTVMIPWVIFGDVTAEQKTFVTNKTIGIMRYLVNEGFIPNLQENPVNLIVTTQTKR